MNEARAEESSTLDRVAAGNGPPENRADSPTFDSLDQVHAHRGLLVRLAYRFCWNLEDAEDAVQSALLLASRRERQLDQRSKLWSWVRSIVVRQCHDIRRQSHRRTKQVAAAREAAELDRRQQTGDPTTTNELGDVLRRLIGTLPERQQTAIVLRHLENMDYRAIGELLGISESTARVHVRNGREALRRAVIQEHPEWSPYADETTGQ